MYHKSVILNKFLVFKKLHRLSAKGALGGALTPKPQENVKDSWIIIPANCKDNISQEEKEALKGFIKSIGKHRVYVDTAYDLDLLEHVKKLYILSWT